MPSEALARAVAPAGAAAATATATARQPQLLSARLRLRPYTLADAADVQRLAGDARIADTTLHVPHPYPDGAAEAWIAGHAAAWAARSGITYAVTLQAGGQLVGCVALLAPSSTHARAELGYWIGVPYQRLGFATEAVQRLIAYAHEALQLTRITGACFARNAASARVLLKAGLQPEGRLVRHVRKHGGYEDLLLFGRVLPGRSPV